MVKPPIHEGLSWEIDVPILKPSGVLGEVLKVLALGALVPFVLIFILWAIEGFKPIIDLEDWKYGAILIGLTLGLTLLFFLLLGNRYPTRYEVSVKGASFITLPQQQRKNKILAVFLVILGVFNRNPTAAGIGFLSASGQRMDTPWGKVRKIVFYGRRRVIALICKDLTRNILFCHQNNVEDVFKMVQHCCPKAQIQIKK